MTEAEKRWGTCLENHDIAERPVHHIDPGYIFFSKQSATMRAVAGSCVVVCLWDTLLRYGGMTHFCHARTRDPKQATPRYGNVATTGLIRIMEEAGCKRENLVAQILGGARPRNKPLDRTGEQNVAAAESVLTGKGVPILAKDVGGVMGRKIAFDTATGESVVLRVHDLRATDW